MLDPTPACLKLDNQRVLVELFVQTGLEFVQYGHGCADDFVREFFVIHVGIFNHDYTDFTNFFSSYPCPSVSSVVEESALPMHGHEMNFKRVAAKAVMRNSSNPCRQR